MYMQHPSPLLLISFCLKLIYEDIKRAIPASFLGPLSSNIFLHSVTLGWHAFLIVTCDFWKKKKSGSYFLILPLVYVLLFGSWDPKYWEIFMSSAFQVLLFWTYIVGPSLLIYNLGIIYYLICLEFGYPIQTDSFLIVSTIELSSSKFLSWVLLSEVFFLSWLWLCI